MIGSIEPIELTITERQLNMLYARIEALEAALRELLELHESDHQTDNDAAIIDFIRAALAPEQDK